MNYFLAEYQDSTSNNHEINISATVSVKNDTLSIKKVKKTITLISAKDTTKNRKQETEDLKIKNDTSIASTSKDYGPGRFEKLKWNSTADIIHKLTDESNFRYTKLLPANSHFKKANILYRDAEKNDWIFGTSFILILLLIWVKLFQKNYMTKLFDSLISYQASNKVFREKNSVVRRISLVMNFFYIIVVSLCMYSFLNYKSYIIPGFSKPEMFLIILNIIILFYLIKTFLHYLAGKLFQISAIIDEFNHNNFVINKNLSLVLFPLFIAYQYLPKTLNNLALIAIISVSLLFEIQKFFRWLKILNRKDIFIFYSFLYLCTLEFLPLLIGYKIIKHLFN